MDTLARGYGLIEGPVWSDERGLIFSDVHNGGVFALGHDGAVTQVFGHRRGIGGIALHAAGGLVVSGRNVAYRAFGSDASVTILDRDEAAGNVGYNDLTTDSAGRIWVGSLGSSPVFADGRAPAAGDLYRIDLDGSAHKVADDVRLTNGLGFSPDGRWLYHSDSRVATVWRYPVETDASVGPREAFVTTRGDGVPDGLVVAVDGSVWVALAGGGHGVAVYGADGAKRDFIRIPEPMCTSLCFGGADLRDLYIVSGSEGSGSERGGSVHRVRVDVAGVPVPLARVRIP